MSNFSPRDCEFQIREFDGMSPEDTAGKIIAKYLLTGMAHHSVYWLYLRELSLTLLKEIGQQALDNALETQSMPANRLDYLRKRDNIDTMFHLWDLLDPYSDEMVESMILEQEELHPGAKKVILSARGF